MTRWSPCVTVLLLGAVGCGGSTGSSESSSGTLNDAGPIGQLTEELRIDGLTEDLVPIGAIAVSPNGTVAVLQGQDYAVRVFGSDGTSLGRFGRQGEGPGEFAFPQRLGWYADTLWVYDPNGYLTFITPDLSLVRKIGDVGTVRVHGVDPAGHILAQRNLVEWPQEIVRIDLSDSSETLLIALPVVPRESVNVRTALGNVTVPFANLPIAGFSPNGRYVAGAMATLEGPDAGTFTLTVVGHTGDTIIDQRYHFEPEEVTRAVADSVLDARVGTVGTRYPEWEAAVRGATRVPPMWPPLHEMVVGNDGSVWIRMRPRDGFSVFYVVAPDGTEVGEVSLPIRSSMSSMTIEGRGTITSPASIPDRLGAALLDRIWVIQRDELGVESVVVYDVAWK